MAQQHNGNDMFAWPRLRTPGGTAAPTPNRRGQDPNEHSGLTPVAERPVACTVIEPTVTAPPTMNNTEPTLMVKALYDQQVADRPCFSEMWETTVQHATHLEASERT